MINTISYEGNTCFEGGFRFSLEAPKELTQEEIALLLQELIDYSDDMSQNALTCMLNDEDHIKYSELSDIETSKIELNQIFVF